ncbi:MAG: hypothetical protein EHM45_04505 [Desulfobacteraceae bacterium]|nr:MAG: hypothetical protein EHM45_04505 [Desulfobacteraceae bacterium]
MATNRGRYLNKILLSALGTAILLVIIVLLNVFLSYTNIRLDLTEDRLYSLSKGTKEILHKMEQPVAVKFFYSRSQANLPADLKVYAQQVLDFLSEYERAGRGKIKIETYDPKPDSDEEEWAQRYGVRPVPTPAGERIYAGLVFQALDQEEKIEVLDPSREKLLEYDITRIIQRLQSAQKKQIAVITSLPVFGAFPNPMMGDAPQGQEPWYFISELKKTYTVRPIDPSESKLDPAPDLLLILHPKELNPQLQYAIDQYVLAGGKVLAFVDPFCLIESLQTQQPMMAPAHSSFEKLLKAWGLNLDSTKIVADLDQFTRIRGGNGLPEDSPVWISVRSPFFNKTDIVSSQLKSMLFPLAGALKKSEGNDYLFEPLIQSSENAALMQSYVASFGTMAVRREFTPAGKRLNLAVRVHGKFKTAFSEGRPQDGKPQANQSSPANAPHLTEAKESATVIVVADADFLADPFYVQKSRFLGSVNANVFNDNLNFVANACETLSGSASLINLRSRGSFERPFTVVRELERQAQIRWLVKEKELVEKAELTNRKLHQLEQQKSASQKTLLSPEQETEIQHFKEERRQINLELKEVRKNLRADIERLGAKLKIVNIFLMPLLVAAAGIVYGVYRQRKTRKK